MYIMYKTIYVLYAVESICLLLCPCPSSFQCVYVEGEGSIKILCLSLCPVCRQQASVSPFSARSIKLPADTSWPRLDPCHVTGMSSGWQQGSLKGGRGLSHTITNNQWSVHLSTCPLKNAKHKSGGRLPSCSFYHFGVCFATVPYEWSGAKTLKKQYNCVFQLCL